ncbi:MAG: hypothetical protein IPI46_06900 [Bacteroidetes bacterium]|nr:hypothetical protein [Bacteroidota bacterium]
MRRAELAITEKKGMSGFRMVQVCTLNKFALHFSQSHYHIAGAYTEMGLSIQLNQLIGSGSKLSWAERYANQYH